jgi:hypothetical protein
LAFPAAKGGNYLDSYRKNAAAGAFSPLDRMGPLVH